MVERRPGKLNRAWVFAGTKVPVSALLEFPESEGAITNFSGVEETEEAS